MVIPAQEAAYTQAYRHGRWRAVQREFVTHIGIPPGSTVFGVGTGSGGTAIEAARVVGPSGHVTGIDNASALIEIAREEARRSHISNVLFEVMDLGGLRFSDNSFDYVLSRFALNGSFPPGIGAQEAYRVLRPGNDEITGYEHAAAAALEPFFEEGSVAMQYEVMRVSARKSPKP